MPDQNSKQELAELAQVNEELTKSLEKCRFLLSECQSKLVANNNNSDASGESEESRIG